MKPLAGLRVLALGGMRERPLARLLASFGALIEQGATREAIEGASFLIEDVGLRRLPELGFTREQLCAWNPQLVHVSVTPFGSEGPRADWKGGELVISAMGGVLRLTGDPDRPPVKEALDACLFHADMAAAAGAMAAHYARGGGRPGQHVDVSAQEVAFSRNVSGILVWQFDQRMPERVGGSINYGKATVRCIWTLADGWCFHSLMTGRFGAPANAALSAWMDELGARNPLRGVDWLRYNRSTLESAVRADWEAAMAAFFAGRTRAEVARESRRRGINACVLATPRDVIEDPHLASRGFWTVDGNRVRADRFFSARVASEPVAPVPAGAPARPRGGPLEGIRVLDFSWALVGSITTKVLGDLGADVIKVESRERPCLSRVDVQVSASRAGQLDDKPWFAHLNTSKRSLALDLKKPEAKEVLEPLIAWADVVVENFSPGTMTKLGLDYESLVRRNPNLVMVSGSVFGQTGPLAQEWGVDGTGAALSSRTYLTGWPDRDPVIPGAVPYGDVIVPYVMAAAATAVLQRRREGAGGAHLDVSMYEVCVQQMWPAIEKALQGLTPMRQGNDDPGCFWQGVLPAAGVDRWIALSVASAAEFERLRALTAPASLEEWSQARPALAAVEALQAAGIAAGVVQDMEDLVDRDAGLRARGALIRLPHPVLGEFEHVRTPLSFSRDANAPYRAPRIGEHGAQIAREIAGLSEARVAQLGELGVLQ
ncbi:MAG TPA: CoA transferase [Steroidobacteraceae bacterium]|nr:CoA transferase [Steroidobacteraceae bacterium]